MGWPGGALQFFVLFVSLLILFNLERTVRSSTGRMRWQIKFMALGAGGLFALRVYLASQALLFSGVDTRLGPINAVALIAANLLFSFSLVRGRSLNVDIYLSRTAIQNSLTLILAGVYLLFVGVMARLAPIPRPGRIIATAGRICRLSDVHELHGGTSRDHNGLGQNFLVAVIDAKRMLV